MTWKRLASSLAAAVLVCGTAACADEPEFNGADTQTTTARQASVPMTVTGCLQSGVGTNTFVLTTAQTAGQAEAATYNLDVKRLDVTSVSRTGGACPGQ